MIKLIQDKKGWNYEGWQITLYDAKDKSWKINRQVLFVTAEEVIDLMEQTMKLIIDGNRCSTCLEKMEKNGYIWKCKKHPEIGISKG
jgi:hypothetical protein